jgi:hypothetical protein
MIDNPYSEIYNEIRMKKERIMVILKQLKRIGFLFTLLAAFAFMPCLNVSADGPSTKATVEALLSAVASNNYAAFVANGAPSLKNIITEEFFKQASPGLSPRLKKGYDLTYLGSFKNHGGETYLWKIVYKDDGDDMLAQLELQNDKVSFFWFPPPPPPPGYNPRAAGSPRPAPPGSR